MTKQTAIAKVKVPTSKPKKRTNKTKRINTTAIEGTFSELYEDVSAKTVRNVLRWYGATQVKYAEKLNVSSQYVSKMLNGTDVPIRWITVLIDLVGGEDVYRIILNKLKQGKTRRLIIK